MTGLLNLFQKNYAYSIVFAAKFDIFLLKTEQLTIRYTWQNMVIFIHKHEMSCVHF